MALLLGAAVVGGASIVGLSFIFNLPSILGLPHRREQYPLESWIDSQKREDAIDPDRPIVDCHHHMFDARIHPKGWPIHPLVIKFLYSLRPSLLIKTMVNGQDPKVVNFFSPFLSLGVPYMVDEMERDVRNLPQPPAPILAHDDDAGLLPPNKSHHNVKATVYIESGWDDQTQTSPTEAFRTVGEAAMSQDVATSTSNKYCTGIVPSVHLSLGADAVRPALKALVERFPNVRGVRDILAYTSHPSLMQYAAKNDMASDPQFRSSFALLKEYNLSFDAWGYHDNLSSIRKLALDFPDTTIVLCHCGSPIGFPPYDRNETFQIWSKELKLMADRCPNVVVKLSGLGLPLVGFGFENRATPPDSNELAEVWKRYILHVIECFGVDRCMFASNFPCDKVSCSYTSLWNAFKRIVEDFSEEDKHKLFYGNAVRVYRLDVPP